MWTLLPSSPISPNEEFFTLGDLSKLSKVIGNDAPVIKGRVWSGEERSHGWMVEAESFEGFRKAVERMSDRVEFFAYDESVLDDETLRLLQEDLHRFAADEGMSQELVSKALSALRSHENELFAVSGYAFLSSGPVIFIRAQNELAKFVYYPDRLLSGEGLSSVRKLRTLVEH